MHRTRWMMSWNIKRGKIMVIILDFRTFSNHKTKTYEKGNNIVFYLRYWMQRTEPLAACPAACRVLRKRPWPDRSNQGR